MILTYARGSALPLQPHFARREFDCPAGCTATKHDTELSAKLERLRALAGGAAVHINSGYRCPAHNAAAGGSPRSQHTLGKAADIRIAGISPVRAAILARQAGFTGVGCYLYGDTAFCHVDVRANAVHWAAAAAGRYTYLADRDGFFPTVRAGSTGAAVRILQRYLGRTVTGAFSRGDAAALAVRQRSLGLAADGVCGPKTWAALR
jgi:peptidoglycan hydrolase-like protein with peptidoglycan-binding domain